MPLGQRVSAEGIPFKPRFSGQTTVFPLEGELQKSMAFLYGGAVRESRVGYIHEWLEDPNQQFRDTARQVLAQFKETLNPFIDGLKLKELCGPPPFGPALMSYTVNHGTVQYRLTFRISYDSAYLIASPNLTCTVPERSRIKPALQALDPNRVYERILNYLFRRKELEKNGVLNVDIVPWGYELYLQPVPVNDIPEISNEFTDVARGLEEYSSVIHQAASLLSLLRAGRKAVSELEAKTDVSLPRVKFEEEGYHRIRELLDTVHIPDTPTLNQYFV